MTPRFVTRALIVLSLAIPAAANAAPCVAAKPECTEWVVLGRGPAQSLIYRTQPLDRRNESIVRGLIMVHGAGRDADNYFRTALAAAFLAGALEDTVVVSPRFASNDRGCQDKLAPNEVSWPCSGDSWRSGGVAAGAADAAADKAGKLTSYDFADAILRKLANRSVFPSLKAIVVAGHSAGGQFVNRYEMANQLHDTLGVPVTYVVANPSSYAYLDATRPSPAAGGPTEFRTFGDARNCTTYDTWPYGLQDRTGYSSRLTDDQLKKQLAARPTTYLVGEYDTLPLAGFDGSCPAMAQGPNRLARGQAFGKYVNEKFGARHTTLMIPLCGHNARCMFTAEPALALIFPKP
jgi:pimeloyl-ACP methyl ester carboxylesterase